MFTIPVVETGLVIAFRLVIVVGWVIAWLAVRTMAVFPVAVIPSTVFPVAVIPVTVFPVASRVCLAVSAEY